MAGASRPRNFRDQHGFHHAGHDGWCVDVFVPETSGLASGLLNSTRQVGGTIGVALLGTSAKKKGLQAEMVSDNLRDSETSSTLVEVMKARQFRQEGTAEMMKRFLRKPVGRMRCCA